MKKLIVVGGVLALLWYLSSRSTATDATVTAAGGGPINDPVRKPTLGGVTLGPSFAQKVPGVASVS